MRRRALLLALPPLALSACGFRLQGSRPLPAPLQRVFLESEKPYSAEEPAVETALRARLRRRGADVTGAAATADSVLTLSNIQQRSEVLSVSTRGRAIEFEIQVEVTFSLADSKGVLVPAQTLSARRALSFPTEQILPKEAEEARLAEFLQDELAERILLQLESRLLRSAGD
jgi:LPS-assembly lipoprotein